MPVLSTWATHLGAGTLPHDTSYSFPLFYYSASARRSGVDATISRLGFSKCIYVSFLRRLEQRKEGNQYYSLKQTQPILKTFESSDGLQVQSSDKLDQSESRSSTRISQTTLKIHVFSIQPGIHETRSDTLPMARFDSIADRFTSRLLNLLFSDGIGRLAAIE